LKYRKKGYKDLIMKRLTIVHICLFLILSAYSQNKTDIVDLTIESYNLYYELSYDKKEDIFIPACIPEPVDFKIFFDQKFIKAGTILEECIFSKFTDSLCSPLQQALVVNSVFGLRKIKRKAEMHCGVDFDLREGDTVYSVFCGKVFKTGFDKTGYGEYVIIKNYNMTETIYAHLSKKLVEEGEIIEVGMPIGLGGNTGRSFGDHLHFELRYYDRNEGYKICLVNPIFENGLFLGKLSVK
jgi:murein DD-endopeptidase MepM/ murein hydrolase activator NlpD